MIGKLDASEQCDHGTNSGKLSGSRDSHSRFRCGNGIKERAVKPAMMA